MTTPDEREFLVVDNQAASRHEIYVDSKLAGFVDYRIRPGRIVFVHTETLDGFEHQGVAGRLVRWALDDARTRHLSVVPVCPYVAAFIEEHPEYADLVAAPG